MTKDIFLKFKNSLSPQKRYINKHIHEFLRYIHESQLIIIDIGAGNSYYRYIFEEITGRYISIDMKHFTNLTVVGVIQTLPFKSCTADVILLIEVLEHVYDTNSALKEINRVLKPHGYLFLSTPFVYGYHDSIDFFRFTENALERLLKENGFEIVAIEKRGGIFACLNASIFHIHSILFKSKISYLLFFFLTPLMGILFLLDYMNIDRDKNFTLGIDILAKKQE